MPLVGLLEAEAQTVIASLRGHEIPATPENYTLWYEYHSGSNPALRRTIDTLVSNRSIFDEPTLRDLYNSFLSSLKEQQAVREASSQALETLHEIIALTDGSRADNREFRTALNDFASSGLTISIETLRSSIENLVQQSRRMAGRTEYLGARMRESSVKIETLERNLETALRDATMDALTGVANRKSFDQTIRRLAGDAMNSGDELALLIVDIDFFKRVNDTWGHQTGDVVLRHVATVLQRAVRGEDFVARYGGEEFAILLPRTDERSAHSVAINLQQALVREPLVMDLTPPFYPVTISAGASCYDHGEPIADWVKRSDEALYQAKAEGRNCTRVFERVLC